MEGLGGAASVVAIFGATGHLVQLGSDLWSAAKNIKETNNQLRAVKARVENLVPVRMRVILGIFRANVCEDTELRWHDAQTVRRGRRRAVACNSLVH
jgi:hypothetical protein